MVANQFKEMHDALSELRDGFCLQCKNYSECMVEGGIPCEIIDRANMALAKKPRQCDIGTPEEQAERFRNFCKMDYISGDCPDDCPLYRKDCSTIPCPFAWEQLPYAAEGGVGK